jgi:hypothetical protein
VVDDSDSSPRMGSNYLEKNGFDQRLLEMGRWERLVDGDRNSTG